MKIYFVRHAEVSEEYIGRYNGHIDISLSKNGQLQAKELGKKLSPIHFDRIYCSDLLRAKQTLEEFGLNQEVIYSKRLREKSWGEHEGMSFDEIQDSGIEYENFTQWLSALDGESVESYTQNLQNYFYKVILQDTSEDILLITHAGVIRTLISITQKITLEDSFKTKLTYSSYLIFNRGNMTFIHK